MRHAHPTASSGVRILVVVAVLAVAGLLLDQLTYQLFARQLPVGVAQAPLGPFPVMRADHWRSLADLWPLSLYLPLFIFLLWAIKDEPFGRLMKVAAVGFGLIVGGTLSNFLSLAFRGFVSDFLVVKLSSTELFIFVPADALMWLGFLLVLVGTGAQLLRPARPALDTLLDNALLSSRFSRGSPASEQSTDGTSHNTVGQRPEGERQ